MTDNSKSGNLGKNLEEVKRKYLEFNKLGKSTNEIQEILWESGFPGGIINQAYVELYKSGLIPPIELSEDEVNNANKRRQEELEGEVSKAHKILLIRNIILFIILLISLYATINYFLIVKEHSDFIDKRQEEWPELRETILKIQPCVYSSCRMDSECRPPKNTDCINESYCNLSTYTCEYSRLYI